MIQRRDADKFDMTPEKLDFYFPFVVFFYGFLVLVVVEAPFFESALRRAGGADWLNLRAKRPFAWISFFVGGLWSLQNLFL